MANILVIDDYKSDQDLLAGPFRSGHDVRCAGDLNEAGRLIENWWPDVAIVDAMFPRARLAPPSFQAGSFLDLIEEKSTSEYRRPQIVIVSGQNDAAKRFEEVRLWLNDGRIADVIPKATADMGINFFEAVLQLRVARLLERRKWRTVQDTAESAAEWFRRLGIITCSPKILALRRDLEAAARSNGCVLLTGESGTGKTLFARALHALTRPGKPFKELSSAAIPPHLFEAELFGIQGVSADHPVYPYKVGLLEAAADGTFFLDDIQYLAVDHQKRLNQVIQERRFFKVRATTETPFMARFICATYKDLANLVQKGEFTEDLYFRIRAFNIHIPKLSERVEDIPGLATSFLEGYVRERRDAGYTCPSMRLHPRSLDMLCAYEWSNNVRHLKGVIETAGAYAAEGADEVEIGIDLLVQAEPGLAIELPSRCAFDSVLANARLAQGHWPDMTEADACTSIRALLSDTAKVQFETMLCALQPRKRDAASGAPGRDSQDPATIHCLKVLLYLLLCPEHSVSVKEIKALVQVNSWHTGKKVMEVLAGAVPASPSYAPFLSMPAPGTRQIGTLLPGVLGAIS